MTKPCKIWTGACISTGYGARRIKGRLHLVHRKAWEDAHGAIPSSMFVCHSCDVRACYELEHLFLGSNDDNVKDAMRKRRHAHGVTTGTCKLTEEQVLAIRTDPRTQRAIGAAYGISHSQVSMIKSGQRWRHL